MQTSTLIQSLTKASDLILDQAAFLNTLDIESLTSRTSPYSWNILECLQHLNLYYDFYLPEIRQAIENNRTQPEATFKPGILGNYFAESMLPKDKLNKMKTFKNKNPLNSNLDKSVIDQFIRNQEIFSGLVQSSASVNLNKAKVKISIAPFIKLKLGDTFRFITNHNIRHFKQIDNILKAQ
ncbi:DinB family protein [Polluticaenibacter yanchengensis]|uniref:DinB family protein n=1 Tax=Polluticaenibacter yanchengensis TaxID=3014562 RepID=A0ABT4UM99_9BACT|nr:DinB family protein [Chitinophagaceae bacterium LY-5]